MQISRLCSVRANSQVQYMDGHFADLLQLGLLTIYIHFDNLLHLFNSSSAARHFQLEITHPRTNTQFERDKVDVEEVTKQ